MSIEKKNIGVFFVGEAVADLKAVKGSPMALALSFGGSAFFGSVAGANTVQSDEVYSGISSFYVGSISNDHFGTLISQKLKESGVNLRYSRQVDHISVISVISVDAKGVNKYEFYGRNKPNTVEDLTRADLPADFEEENRLFNFGSIITNFTPAREAMRQLAKEQADKGHIVYFDPNTRPSIIPNRDEYCERLKNYAGFVVIMRFSQEDIDWCFPELSVEQSAEMFLGLGAKVFIVTHSESGCTVFTRDGKINVSTQRLENITNTVGAGDNFNAGITMALAKRGISKTLQLNALSLEDWRVIADEANQVAHNHLKAINFK